ncbi:MAG: sulfatase-like hydrolase/transferase [Burkholderiaceae bacterium]
MSAPLGAGVFRVLTGRGRHFVDEHERLSAISAYHGLCSWMDEDVGRIIAAIGDKARLTDTTHVVYTSDHGDNVGARGLWGKGNLCEESVRVPMLLAGPGVRPGVRATRRSICSICIDDPARGRRHRERHPTDLRVEALAVRDRGRARGSVAADLQRIPCGRFEHRRVHDSQRRLQADRVCAPPPRVVRSDQRPRGSRRSRRFPGPCANSGRMSGRRCASRPDPQALDALLQG